MKEPLWKVCSPSFVSRNASMDQPLILTHSLRLFPSRTRGGNVGPSRQDSSHERCCADDQERKVAFVFIFLRLGSALIPRTRSHRTLRFPSHRTSCSFTSSWVRRQ